MILYICGTIHYEAKTFGYITVYAYSSYCKLAKQLKFNSYNDDEVIKTKIFCYSALGSDTPVEIDFGNIDSGISSKLSRFMILRSSNLQARVINFKSLSTFSVCLSISKNSFSTIVFESNIRYNLTNTIYIYVDVEGPLLDASEYLCFRENITLLSSVTSFPNEEEYLYFNRSSMSTHGFDEYPLGCFAIRIDKLENRANYILYPVVLPASLPYIYVILFPIALMMPLQ